MSISSVQVACDPVKQSLAALRTGQESFARFITELFADFDSLRQKLCAAEAQFAQEKRTIIESSTAAETKIAASASATESLRERIGELEEERRQLEEELESVRAHSVSMAQVVEEQKRQMAEENAGWTAELRQLRRILDKQATWIAQQRENSSRGYSDADPQQYASADDYPSAPPPILPIRAVQTASQAAEQPAAMRPTGTAGRVSAGHHDAVLGSVLSQFELLQRDVARRRDQNMLSKQTGSAT